MAAKKKIGRPRKNVVEKRVYKRTGKYAKKGAPKRELPQYVMLGGWNADARDHSRVTIDGAHGLRCVAPGGREYIDLTWDQQAMAFKVMASDSLSIQPVVSNVAHLSVCRLFQEKQQ